MVGLKQHIRKYFIMLLQYTSGKQFQPTQTENEIKEVKRQPV